jgi:hypothetical protein
MIEETQSTGNTNQDAAASQESKWKKKQSFERELVQIGRGIDLSINDDTLNGYASEYGYSAERLNGLKTYYDETESAYETQQKALAKQRAATRLFVQNKGKAEARIAHLVATARLAFKNDPDTYDALGLRGKRKRAYGEWVAQNKHFFENLLIPETAAQMTGYKVTMEEMQAGNQELLDTITADTAQENAKAEAQKATELKNKAWRRLKRAWRKYINIMKEALEDDPQMKEKLGIVAPYEA